MEGKIKIAVNWAGACGGCDVSILDIEGTLLDLAAVADIVYWPVAMDFKRKELESYGPGEIDVFELHDAFSIMAALSLEACGFCDRGHRLRKRASEPLAAPASAVDNAALHDSSILACRRPAGALSLISYS